MLWQKFVFIVAGYWFLERISQLFPACKQLKSQPHGLINSTNRLLPAFKYLIKKPEKRSLKQCLWGRKTAFHWLMIILFGFAMAPIFTHLEQYPVFMDVQDAVGIDWLMRITQQNIPSVQDGVHQIPQFVWLDIDDNTHRQWGEPLFTPRNRIQRLINAAVKAQARLIIVDIDLSRPTPIEGLQSKYNDLKIHPYDEELANYLAQYPSYCQTHPSCPAIILARPFLKNSNGSSPPSYYQPRLAFEALEQAVANSKGYIQWASPRFYQSRDQVIRRHHHWQPICTDEQPGMIASIGVTATILLNSETPKLAQDTLNQALVSLQPQNCTGTDIPSRMSSKEIDIGFLKLNTDPYGVRQRIVFSMPWLIENQETEKQQPLKWLSDEAGFPIVTRLPAVHFASTDVSVARLESLKNDYVKNGIVILGASHREGRDFHETPLGSMPGALVIINAIHSLLYYQQINPLPIVVKWLIIATLILVMAMVFLCVASFWLAQMLNLLIIIGMMFVSVILFRNAGLWLDFATPLIFVQLYQIAIFSGLLILCLLLSVWRWIQRIFKQLYLFLSRFHQ